MRLAPGNHGSLIDWEYEYVDGCNPLFCIPAHEGVNWTSEALGQITDFNVKRHEPLPVDGADFVQVYMGTNCDKKTRAFWQGKDKVRKIDL